MQEQPEQQEQAQDNAEKPAKQKLPAVLIAVLAVVGLLGLAGIGTAYGLSHKNYSGYLGQLKVMIAADADKLQKGDPAENATLRDQYDYYDSLKGEIGNLSVILTKLNDNYPLLPGRSSEKSLGIAGLKAQMDKLSPMLATLHECLDEDASITNKLTELLDRGASADISADISALASRNDALDIRIAGISFSGSFEDKRAEFAAGIKKRGIALHYLEEDSAIQSELLSLLADVQTPLPDIVAKLKGLGERNDALAGKAYVVEIEGISLAGSDFYAVMTGRGVMITESIGYLTELETMQGGIAAFCKELEGAPVQGGNFSGRFAKYKGWIQQLKTLEEQLKAINDKPGYAALATKRTIADLGMTPAGEKFLSYEAALTAFDAGITASNAMEKQIDALLKNTKMTLPDETSALVDISTNNDAIIKSLLSGLPDDLADGFAAFIAGCRERTVFLDAFIAYVDDKVHADSYNAQYKYYLRQRSSYLQSAAYWGTIPGHSADVNHFKQLANDQSALANTEKAGYNASLKQENADKAAYEASRKKYQALFAG